MPICAVTFFAWRYRVRRDNVASDLPTTRTE